MRRCLGYMVCTGMARDLGRVALPKHLENCELPMLFCVYVTNNILKGGRVVLNGRNLIHKE